MYDPFVSPDIIEKAGFESATLEELYQKSDYITIHVPKLDDTVGFLNKEAFAQMKNGAMIINCARGGIVNEADLYDALKSGKIAGAALDVFQTEPPGKMPLFVTGQYCLHASSGRIDKGSPDQCSPSRLQGKSLIFLKQALF